jgi:hypothetical protein
MKNNNLIPVAFLLLIFSFLTISSLLQLSGTCDEIAHHVPVGYVLLSKGDFKFDTSQPPLSRYIVALPLKLFLKLNLPSLQSEWRLPDRGEFGRNFFFKYNHDPRRILICSRLAIVFVGIICGLILFSWARTLYGVKSAFLSLFLYSFSPNIIAHSGLATTDMVATCFMLLSLYTFWLYLRNNTYQNVFLSGACLGLAQLSKYTAFLLYPLFFIFFCFELFSYEKTKKSHVAFKFVSIVFISLLVIWAGYGFDVSPILQNAMRQQEKLIMFQGFLQKIIPSVSKDQINYLLYNLPFPLGINFLGMLGVLKHGASGHGTFFMGNWSGHGNVLYFLVAFLIKTPIATIIFFLAGLLVSFKNKIKKNEIFIFTVILAFFAVSSLSKLQLGLRYILPLYPLFFIVAGRSVELFKTKKIIMVLLMVWLVVSSLWIWPNYLSYFNEVVGGPKNGAKYLRDSNIDWGQNLPALAKYLKANKIDEITFEYFGQDDPKIYGINFRSFPDEEYLKPEAKVYAVSAHYLSHVSWTTVLAKTAMAGWSIYVYDLREKDEKK